MKKNIIILMLLLLCSVGASGQTTLRTAYFSEGITTRHTLNPALVSEYNYFAVPMLGNINFGISSDIGVTDFLYPLDSGKYGTFLHPDVDSSEFLNSIGEDTFISQDLDIAILSLGFHGFGGYNTFGITLRENMGINLNKSLFEFLAGSSSSDSASIYNMGGSTLDMTAWTEIALGHTRRVGENLTVGVKVKYLVGLVNANLSIDQMDFASSSDMLSLSLQSTGSVAMMGMSLDGALSEIAFDAFDMANGMNSGFGLDLGATYQWDRFNFSAALTDLGSITWNSPSSLTVGTDIEFDGFSNIDFDDFEGSTEADLDDLESSFDDLSDPSFSLADSYKTKLNSKLNIGVEYALIEDKLTAGLLSTTTFGTNTISETMIAASYSPVKWFNVALSGTASSYGTSMGCLINFCPSWINFFIGTDNLLCKVTPQGIPYKSTKMNINFGLSIPLGKGTL